MLQFIQKIDEIIINWVNLNLSNSHIQELFSYITKLNDHGILTILIIIAINIKYKNKKIALITILSAILSLVIVQLSLKNIIARPRPFETLNYLKLIIDKPTSYSFPSGHSSFSGVGFMLSYYFFDNNLLKNLLMTTFILVGISRLVIKVHYLSDIIVGFSISIVLVHILYKLFINSKIILNKN